MVISQETALFEATLKENIDPLDAVKDDNVLRAIMKKLEFNHQGYADKGLEMKIDADGGNLSQGEKQLICFSRTLINKKKLIIFDEATANIDLKTEEIIQKTVREEFNDTTMLIIAHRVQTVQHCDRIMVLNAGKIDEFDKPEILLKTPGSYYKEIYEKTIKKKEEE